MNYFELYCLAARLVDSLFQIIDVVSYASMHCRDHGFELLVIKGVPNNASLTDPRLVFNEKDTLFISLS